MGAARGRSGERRIDDAFAFVIGDVGSPGVARAGDLALTPVRDAGECGAGVGPVDEVLGSAYGDDAAGSVAPAAGTEDVVRVLLFDDDGIVHAFDVAREFEDFRFGGSGGGDGEQCDGANQHDRSRRGRCQWNSENACIWACKRAARQRPCGILE